MHGKNETTIGDAKSQKKVVGDVPCFSGKWRESDDALRAFAKTQGQRFETPGAAGCVNFYCGKMQICDMAVTRTPRLRS
jgi:hypothetical protein